MGIKLTWIGAAAAMIVIWYFVWIIAATILRGVNDLLWEVPHWNEEWIYMAPTLIRRVISYFLLLYGQLAIIRYCLFKNTDLDASLLAGLEWDNIVAKAAARTAYWGTQPNGQYFWKLKALSGLATLLLIWLVVWWWFSDITFFFCCSHFLYDQDPGDLPFWLDSLYPLPLFIITAGLGVAYLAIIYGAKIGAEATSAQAEHLRQSLGDQ